MSIDDKILTPVNEPVFGEVKEPAAQGPRPVLQPNSPAPASDYTKIMKDMIDAGNYNDKVALKANLDKLYLDRYGQVQIKSGVRKEYGVLLAAKQSLGIGFSTQLNIPTLDVLSCYIENGEALRTYVKLIGYQDKGSIVVQADSLVAAPEISLPNSLFLDKNVELATENGIDIRSLLHELVEVRKIFVKKSSYEITWKMQDLLRKYCPKELQDGGTYV